jgi:alkylated DNA repair dioxygenase AlkB
MFGREPATFDAGFTRLQRVALPPDAWIEHVPGWLAGHEQLFDALVNGVRWRKERREMYDRIVDVPRLYAVLPDDGAVPPIIESMRSVLSSRYGEAFSRISLGYYRDGRDSVAWHGDYVARKLPTAIVATVSLGAPRRFLLRPKGGGRSLALSLGWGDLLIMGGSCQRTWQHAVPKVKSAPPRIALMFRPIWIDPDGTPDEDAYRNASERY